MQKKINKKKNLKNEAMFKAQEDCQAKQSKAEAFSLHLHFCYFKTAQEGLKAKKKSKKTQKNPSLNSFPVAEFGFKCSEAGTLPKLQVLSAYPLMMN